MVHLLLGIIYLAFVSLGLPDSLLGSAWPSMREELGVPLSYSGIIFMIIALCTVISSLQSDRLTRRLGAGRVTALSVLTTAVALWGFSTSGSFWLLCVWAVPYGLGAGSVDAALNNYVALNFASRHMNWLHCMWGVGASLGPWIMERALTGGQSWNAGYRTICILQIGLTAILFLSLPLWRQNAPAQRAGRKAAPLSLREALRMPGAKEVMVAFFCYCAFEQTLSLWASSYLVMARGLSAQAAAGYAGLFFLGITVGRALSGFLTLRFSDTQMTRIGQALALAGVAALLLCAGEGAALAGLVMAGLGCAPIYPSIIHATPQRFGQERSQAVIGIEMAAAYTGTCAAPPLFGVIAGSLSASVLPVFLLIVLAAMALAHEALVKKTRPREGAAERNAV